MLRVWKLVQEPLLFYSCGYEELSLRRSAACTAANLATLEELLRQQLARAALLHAVTQRFEEQCRQTAEVPVTKPVKHIKLSKRPREMALEAKFAKFGRTLGQPGWGVDDGDES